MDDKTQIQLNRQSIEKLEKMTELQLKVSMDQDNKLNSLVLSMGDLKTNGEWLMKTVENHIKNSVPNIEQIEENRVKAASNETEVESVGNRQDRNDKVYLVALVVMVGAMLKVAFFK